VTIDRGGTTLIKFEGIRDYININSCRGCRERPKFAASGRSYRMLALLVHKRS